MSGRQLHAELRALHPPRAHHQRPKQADMHRIHHTLMKQAPQRSSPVAQRACLAAVLQAAWYEYSCRDRACRYNGKARLPDVLDGNSHTASTSCRRRPEQGGACHMCHHCMASCTRHKARQQAACQLYEAHPLQQRRVCHLAACWHVPDADHWCRRQACGHCSFRHRPCAGHSIPAASSPSAPSPASASAGLGQVWA